MYLYYVGNISVKGAMHYRVQQVTLVGFERPSVSNSSDSIDRLRRMSYRCNIRAYCIQYVELRLVCVRAYYICVYDDTDEETC